MEKKKKDSRQRVLTVIGIIICVILIPILIINGTLLVKSFTEKDAVPSFGGYTPMIVLSDSMLPVIKSGDIIICEKVSAEDVKEGDVISFFDPAGNGTSVVTHRVIEITEQNGQTAFRTQGDNNNVADLSLVNADRLVGRYSGTRLAGLGKVAMFMQTTAGLIICVGVPLLLFIGYYIIRRRGYEKKQQADTEALRAELELLRSQQKKDE